MALFLRDSRRSVIARVCAGLLLCTVLAAVGCPSLPPPSPPLPREIVIALVRAQETTFHSVKDGDISLAITETVDGKAKRLPTLGGSIAFNSELPGLWLIGTKVTKTIFSLKALGPRFWLALYRTEELVTGGPAAYEKLPTLLRPDEVRSFFADPEWLGLTGPDTTMTTGEDNYQFDVYSGGVLRRQVLVERQLVVVRSIRRYDPLGRLETQIDMADYDLTDGVLFPRVLTVDRPLLGVKVELSLSDPKLNVELPANVFLPPELPEGWKQIDLDREPLSAVKGLEG